MDEIRDYLYGFAPLSMYDVPTHDGRSALRIEFGGLYELELAFLGLIGNRIMKGHSSKAIGNTLLIWKR